MPDPRLPRGVVSRLAIVLGAAALLLFPRLTRADEARWDCQPIGQAERIVKSREGSAFIRLTDAQWQFLRGIFAALPDTPESLPPGDHAMISTFPDGSGAVAFADGDLSCVLIALSAPYVAMVVSVGEGDVIHPGDGL